MQCRICLAKVPEGYLYQGGRYCCLDCLNVELGKVGIKPLPKATIERLGPNRAQVSVLIKDIITVVVPTDVDEAVSGKIYSGLGLDLNVRYTWEETKGDDHENN
jgi:hypothetical protein